MLTRKELAAMLRTVDARDVAKLAGVSVKTIYRLRAMQNAPTLDTAERLVAAVQALRPKALRV